MLTFRRSIYTLLLALCLLFLNACSEGGYLLQCAKGQWDLMARSHPIEDVLAEETESQSVRDQLVKVVALHKFAVDTLRLPDTGSYREYADLERPYAVWNLVVAPELSLDLKQWCFPVAGCVTYRGYFDETSARAAADDFSAQGFDVDVYGVQAYSTLNWFDDPVLNTFLSNDDISLAALLFHEMAHQIIYVPNDTTFNESFAKAVEMEGLRLWLKDSASPELWQQCLQYESFTDDFQKLLTTVRTDLARVYSSDQDSHQMRLEKQDILMRANEKYEDLKSGWGGYEGFDHWMNSGLNNARLSSVATYHDFVPAFNSLLRKVNYDLPLFYSEVKALAALKKEKRSQKLNSLTSETDPVFD